MTRVAKMVLLVVLLLLLPAQALAECAWVLWGGMGSHWVPVQGYTSRDDCMKDKVGRIANATKQRPGGVTSDFGVTWTEGDRTQTLRVTCLPDTINPLEKEER